LSIAQLHSIAVSTVLQNHNNRRKKQKKLIDLHKSLHNSKKNSIFAADFEMFAPAGAYRGGI